MEIEVTVNHNFGSNKEITVSVNKRYTQGVNKRVYAIIRWLNKYTEMYPGFQIMGSSGPLLEKFGGPLLSFGGPANL